MFESFTRKFVTRLPNLIVPPKCVLEISGMKITTGCGVFSSNSVEFAPSRPRTLRQNSMVATCNPKQIPRYGTLFSLAYFAANNLPSIPRSPKPPGTKIPSERFKACHESWVLSSRLLASIHSITN